MKTREHISNCLTLEQLKDLALSYNRDWDIMFPFFERAAEIGMLEGIERGMEGAAILAPKCYCTPNFGSPIAAIRAIKPETLMPKESE